jgi:hypothetical protein
MLLVSRDLCEYVCHVVGVWLTSSSGCFDVDVVFVCVCCVDGISLSCGHCFLTSSDRQRRAPLQVYYIRYLHPKDEEALL